MDSVTFFNELAVAPQPVLETRDRIQLRNLGKYAWAVLDHTGKNVLAETTTDTSVKVCKMGLQFGEVIPMTVLGDGVKVKDLCRQIELEKDPQKFSELVKELNDLLDGSLPDGDQGEKKKEGK